MNILCPTHRTQINTAVISEAASDSVTGNRTGRTEQ
jgi:hypothetical protein